jgi:hypothetical protein
MSTFYATVWFFFIFLCPGITLVASLFAVLSSQTLAQGVARSAVLTLVLTLAIGPVVTNVGFMPWWFSGSNLTSFEGAKYLLWQYAAICLTLQLLLIGASFGLRRLFSRRGG